MYHVSKESKEYYAGVTRIVEAPPPEDEEKAVLEKDGSVVDFGPDAATYSLKPDQLPPPGMIRPPQQPPRNMPPPQQIQLQQLQRGRPGTAGAQAPPDPFAQGGSPSFNNGTALPPGQGLPSGSPVPMMPATFGPASPFVASGPGGSSPHPSQGPPGGGSMSSPQAAFHPQFLQAQAMQQQQLGAVGAGPGMMPNQVFGQQGGPSSGMFASAGNQGAMGFPGQQPQLYGQNVNPPAMLAARAGMNASGSYPPGTSGTSAVQIPPGIIGQTNPMMGGDAMSGGGTAINLQNLQSMGGLQQQQQAYVLQQQQMQLAALMRQQQQAQQQQSGGQSGIGGMGQNAFMNGRPAPQQPGISPQQMGNPQQLVQPSSSQQQQEQQGTLSPSPGLSSTPRARVDGRPQRQPRERKGTLQST